MSSVPQGWHGITGPSKISTSSSVGLSGSFAPTTIRKKWNSPQASNVAQTKLPSYKSSNLRQQNCNLNSTYQIKPPMPSCSTQQTKLPTPTKPSPVKEYKAEIEKLKKELSTTKAENSILKAKVRRVDDENVQKGRQIEKMKAEIKALQMQKNESTNSKKSKESQELFVLRQKCLRLESALKDKDFAIKKLTSESSVKREDSESSKIPNPFMQKQSYRVTSANKQNEKESVSAKSSLSRASLSLKTEVTKLRDMIHKLEKENQDLQQQAKQHCQEIRRLKVQMKSKDKATPPQTSVSKSGSVKNTKNKSVLTTSNNQGNLQSNVSVITSSVPRQRLVKSSRSALQNSSQASTKQPVLQKSNIQKSFPKTGKTSSLPNGNIKQVSKNKQVKGTQSKLPVTKSGLAHAASKPIPGKSGADKSVATNDTKKSELEHKVQEMRENIAAKKIQRSWRQHQKCLQCPAESEFQNNGKALSFIVSSLKHHKSRKAKLNLLVKKKNNLPGAIEKEAFMEVIKSVAVKVWDQDHSSS